MSVSVHVVMNRLLDSLLRDRCSLDATDAALGTLWGRSCSDLLRRRRLPQRLSLRLKTPWRRIHQIDPETGAILRTIESNRFVTGVTWIDGELWHGTWEGDESEVRRVDQRTGEKLWKRCRCPPATGVSGLESDGGDRFFCGGGSDSGVVRAVRRPRRGWRRSLGRQHVRSGLVTGVTDKRMSPHLGNERMRRDGHVDHVGAAFGAGGRPLFLVGRRVHAPKEADPN
jgi:hypothetical protein